MAFLRPLVNEKIILFILFSTIYAENTVNEMARGSWEVWKYLQKQEATHKYSWVSEYSMTL